MCEDRAKREELLVKLATCAAWCFLFAMVCAGLTAWASAKCQQWCEGNLQEQRHAALREQIDLIRQGDLDCLVQPDPQFIHEVLDDPACVARIRAVDLAGDLSDERLGRLRELTNLSRLVLLFARRTERLLDRVADIPTVEEVDLIHTHVAKCGIDALMRLPRLKVLSLSAPCIAIGDMEGMRNHPTLEDLLVTHNLHWDDSLVSLLQSLPRLRKVTITGLEEAPKALEQSLRRSLPGCECHVSH